MRRPGANGAFKSVYGSKVAKILEALGYLRIFLPYRAQEIVRNVAQAAVGTGEVTANIAGVATAAEETGEAAAQVLASAGALSRQSEHLSAEV